MPLPLPNLDDRRWEDLVEEGRALIPLYGPDWTDHNLHDPGITIMELLAWVTEMDIYWLNRVPDAHRRKFLAMAGVTPRPPQPARTVLHLRLKAGATGQHLPAGVYFEAARSEAASPSTVPFRTLTPLAAIPGEVQTLQLKQGDRFTDLTGRLLRGEALALWGDDPQPGAELYIGLSDPPPVETPVTLYAVLEGEHATWAARARLIEEAARRAGLCRPQFGCANEPGEKTPVDVPLPPHHSVALSWEYLGAGGRWHPLAVTDDTRAFTLSGSIVLALPAAPGMSRAAIGAVPEPAYYLRCRLRRGSYDAAPVLRHLLLNGVAAEQTAAAGVTVWLIAPGANLPADPPQPGTDDTLNFSLDASGAIADLRREPNAPALRVLAFEPPDGRPGRLVLAVETPGEGDGRPHQQIAVAWPQVAGESLRVFTREGDAWRVWEQRPDFDAAGRADAHFVLDARTGEITFGDGERGRAVPPGVPILAAYDSTLASGGALKPNRTFHLPDSPTNRALLAEVAATAASLEIVTNPVPASGGAEAETVDQAAGRALAELQKPTRAVTAADYEALAFETPGVTLARVGVRPNLHPGFPCWDAPGVVTVIILPHLPAGRPEPSCETIRQVAAYLARRRIVGTRIEVVGPTYRTVAVQASVRACQGERPAALRERLIARLDAFFDPLIGGPEGGGWPFGRDVYRSEVLQLLDETPGVEHVISLELLGDDCEPGCGNVCIGPVELVDAGEHEITVIAWEEGRYG